MLVSANDLIALYLGLELMSLALYVVAAFHRDNLRASEAGLKYFVLGALSSGMLLYGSSLLYGFAGTVSFAGIAGAIHGHPDHRARLRLVFIMAGLAFKMSPCRSTCGRRTSTKARRRRSPPSSPPRPRSPPWPWRCASS
jgi:NADH-quinone oxidoreductase subunit N